MWHLVKLIITLFSRKDYAMVFMNIFVIFCAIANREPQGPLGQPGSNVMVRFRVPTVPKSPAINFYVSGDIQLVRLAKEVNGVTKNDIIPLKIKTSKGWYESPRTGTNEPIDWKKNLEIEFVYPKDHMLRKSISHSIHVKQTSLFGILPDKTTARWGCPPLNGELLKISLNWQSFKNGFEDIHFMVERTNGLWHKGSGAGKGKKVEILVNK